MDWALGYPFVPEATIGAGRKLETAVYLHWRRQRRDLGYWADETEVDLVVNIEEPQLIANVALSVAQPRTWEREIAALQSAGAKWPRAARVLIVGDAGERKAPAAIELVEAWQYLLSGPAKA